MNKLKVLLIYTGGTIGMIKNIKTSALESFDFDNLMKYVPEVQRYDFQLDTIAFDAVDSANISPVLWKKLVATIEKNYFKYNGFVVLHGTDTMAYSASALSFLLENNQKPVIFTGSQLPIGTLRTDGKENLITAIEIAGAYKDGKPLVPEVAICFQNQLFRGNRTRKYNAEYFDAFESPNYPHLADIGIEINYNSQYINYLRQTKPVHFHQNIDENIAIVKLFPGISQKVLEGIINIDGLRGIILETYGAGNAPTEKWFFDILKIASDKKISLLNVTQCNAGSVKLGLYETSLLFLDLGVISGKDITTEAAVAKMMFLLGQNFSKEQIDFYLSQNLCGEMAL
jgi:L-asparaginase